MKFTILHESEKRIRIHLPFINMSMHEADLIEYFLKNTDGVSDASVDERTGNAKILFSDTALDKKEILTSRLSEFNGNLVSVPEETGRAVNRQYEERIVFKAIGHIFFSILPYPVRFLRVIIKSLPYMRDMLKSLFSGRLRVELLDGTAILSSILRGDLSTAGSVMFLLETGGLLEEWTRKKTIGDLARSMSLNIKKVWVRKGQEDIEIPIENVRKGDLIVLRDSCVIPLDGIVYEGEITVNQQSMTGESEPVWKRPGGFVYSGTVVEEGQALIEVKNAAGCGRYDRIVRMIEESEKLKSETEARAYKLADGIVPYSFLGFGVTYLLTRNLTKALSFLMVDFSCAMKLSMPLSVLSAMKEARNYGISVKGGKFLEILAEADSIVFDKTGTLTNANPSLMDIVTIGDTDRDEALRIAACLEEHYPHSVARAIVKGALDRDLRHDELHSRVDYIVAHGVKSYIGDKKAVIGSWHFVIEDEKCIIPEGEEKKIEDIREEYSKIYLAIDGVLRAVLCIFDPVRPEAEKLIKGLHEAGFKKVSMMTGDNEKAARAVSRILNIDSYRSEVLPEDKALFIKELQKNGHRVIMVGDGINDSPALSEADAGICVESGADIAKEISDIMIPCGDIRSIIRLRKISEALMERINDNYRFIVGFNSLLIMLGLIGILTPSMSALLHNASTIMTGVKSTTKLMKEDV